MIEWGFGSGCSSPSSRDNAASVIERDVRALSPLSSRIFTSSSILMLTIHKMPPLAFGIHNEQYDCDMVII